MYPARHHLTCLLFACFAILAPGRVTAGQPIAGYVDVNQFQSADGTGFIELNLAVDGYTVAYRKVEGGYQASVLVYLEIRQGDTNVVYNNKFNLQSPITPDTSKASNLYNTLYVERVALPPGSYTAIVQMQDNYTASKTGFLEIFRQFEVAQPDINKFAFSDIAFVKSVKAAPDQNQKGMFFKRGLEIVPYVTNSTFYNDDTLRFYLELYRPSALTQQPYFITASIVPANSNQKLDKYIKNFKPRMPETFDAPSTFFDISQLASDTYYLLIEVKSNDNKLLASTRKKFFVYNESSFAQYAFDINGYDQVFGYPEDQLDEYLRPMYLLCSDAEATLLGALETYKQKKEFFYTFWKKRRESVYDPIHKPFQDFWNRVKYANQNFKTLLREGWQTDRGRVLLVYGTPADVQYYKYEQALYPHEIWTYNSLRGQAGVFFVFYDKDLVSNAYELMHSTLKGEPFNSGWRQQLIKNTPFKIPANYNMQPEQNADPFMYQDDKVLPGSNSGMPR